eukprot:TRINITY_DN23909_c0_g3_i1.p1 TRINITY_DN23909_c0_g3~~TRINITY_DN23909_c0_g3_i1.p1  ORF type:complete len:384 (-),score=76.78 TRINITY_DN23909_c0_g3_i1:283-1434(-)
MPFRSNLRLQLPITRSLGVPSWGSRCIALQGHPRAPVSVVAAPTVAAAAARRWKSHSTASRWKRAVRHAMTHHPLVIESNSQLRDAIEKDAEVNFIYDQIARNGSGSISFQEFAAFVDPSTVRSRSSAAADVAEATLAQHELRYAFEEADLNGDGVLCRAELGATLLRLGLLSHRSPTSAAPTPTSATPTSAPTATPTSASAVARSKAQRPAQRRSSRQREEPLSKPLRTAAAGFWTEHHRRRRRAAQRLQRWRASSWRMCRDFLGGMELLRRQTVLAWRLASGPLAGLSSRRRALVRRASADLAKVVPFLMLNLVPGGSLTLVLLLRYCPSFVPSTFARSCSAHAERLVDHLCNEFDELSIRVFTALRKQAMRSGLLAITAG